MIAIVLAAGEGRRMKSDLPKVLHRAAGVPLIGHVLEALRPLELDARVVVVPPQRDDFTASLAAMGLDAGVTFVTQDTPRGTADAANIALTAIEFGTGPVLIVPGDTPLLTTETLSDLLDMHSASSAAVTMLTSRMQDPTGYGRVVRGTDGVDRIVEHGDATDEEKKIDEVNSGVYVFEAEHLQPLLAKVDRENVQSEYYLTDVIQLLRDADHAVGALEVDPSEVAGVNTRVQLAEASSRLRARVCRRLMDAGVTIIDPQVTYIDASVAIEADAIIHPFTYLEGSTTVGSGAEVGPQARVVDSEIGPHATVSFAVVRGSSIGPEASVGPYASLRAGTRLARGARVGTFVETKAASLGEGSRAPHLTYLGDATIGADVNVGAGTITCNWDGQSKHSTTIEDEAYIGSDTMLVAPVHIGKRAATGAGAVVRGEVPDDALAVGVPARVIEGKGDKMRKRGRKGTKDEQEPRQ